MIQFLLPLLGSIGGGALAGKLGSGMLMSALLKGGGSFLGSKLAGADTKDALVGGLLTGGLGALGSGFGRGANAAQEATKATTALPASAAGEVAKTAGGFGSLAAPTEGMGALFDMPNAAMPGSAQLTQQTPRLMPSGGVGGQASGAGLGSMMGRAGNWIRENPGLALTGAGAIASLLPHSAAVPTETPGPSMGAQEQFPERRGPRQGYGRANMTPDQYRTYGQVGGITEFPFFEDSAPGGRVTGGPPGTDTVPAVGPGGQEFRLNNGEYVLPRDAVNAIGVRNLDRLRSRFV